MSQQVSFGELLRRYRSAAGLTQEALAERARLSTRGISDLERGARQLPRRDTVQLLADALGLAPPDHVALEAAARRGAEPALPFVGRARELSLLERHLAGQGPPVLLLAGEPGIGKSRLLQEAAQRAGVAGWTVIQGGCHRRGGQEPYTPLVEALALRIQRMPAAQARAKLQGCVWLARLLPELVALMGEPLPNWTLTPEQERRLMFGAVGRYLAGVAGPAGTLLVLDDLQWAGTDALELLVTLIRSAETPLRVVGAYRSTEVRPDDPLSATLADLAAAGLAVQRALAPLAPQEARDLIDRLLEETTGRAEVREQVLQRTGGVPFFVVSCAQRLRHSADGGDEQEGVPWDVAQSVRQRVAMLPEEARDLLSVAAVAGRVVPRALLAATSARPDAEVVATLEAACQARVLEEEADAYRFAHDLIREVVEADLSGARRTLLHRRIAAALEARPGPPAAELLAYHYSRGDAPDKAVLWLERAGDHARAQAAHAAAAGYYREAAERLDRLGRAADAAAVRDKLGLTLGIAAQYDAALEALDQAAETHRALGDWQSLMRTVAAIGQVHAVRGTVDDGIGRIQALLARFEVDRASPGLAALYAKLAQLYFLAGRYGEQLIAAERAVELARDVADVKLQAEVTWMHGLALACTQRLEDGTRAMEEASRLAEAIGDLFTLSHALNNLAIWYGNRGEHARSRSCSERALEVAEQLGDPALVMHMASQRGAVAEYTGAWDQARAFYERALAISRQIGPVFFSAAPLCELGHLCLCKGDWDAACRYLEEALAIAERVGSLWDLLRAQRMLAEHDLLRGRPEAAQARVTPLLDRPDLKDHELSADLLLVQAWAHLDLDEVARADEVVTQAVTRARAGGGGVTVMDALRVQAMVATRQERWMEAERIMEEGLALAHTLRYAYGEGRFLHVYGLMLAHKGEPGPARERLEAALAIFQRLGVRKDAERTEQAIADLHRP